MNKLTLSVVLVFLLAGCDTQTMVPAPPASSVVASASSGQSSSETAPQVPASRPTSSAPSQSGVGKLSPSDYPTPEGAPARLPEAIDLPDTLYTGMEGFGLDLLTPAQYWMSAPSGQAGVVGFAPVDGFLAYPGQDVSRTDPPDGVGVLFNPNGKLLDGDISSTPALIGQVYSASRDGKAGLVSAADGQIVRPFEYQNAYPISNDTFALEQNGQVELVDGTGKTLYTISRENKFIRLTEEIDAVQEDGTLKFVNHADGSPIKNLACDDSWDGPVLAHTEGQPLVIGVKVGNSWGLVDEHGEFLVQPVYDELLGVPQGDYAAVRKNGKAGVVDILRDKLVVKTEWDDLVLYPGSASVRRGEKWGSITDLESGKLGVDLVCDFVYGFSAEGYASFERGGKFGLIDREGNEIVPPKYAGQIETYQSSMDEGTYLVRGDGPHSFGVLSGGQLVIPTDHTVYLGGINAELCAQDEPLSLVRTPSGKWGYIDGQGQYVISAQFDKADGFVEGLDLAMVQKNGKIGLLNRSGALVLETVFEDCIGWNPETRVAAMRYTDATGKTRDCLVKLILPDATPNIT